ncbi:enterochelin esterase, partial [Actinomadura adrarensis]
GALVPEVWRRWLHRDPVRMAPAHAADLRTMRGIWIDAGMSDEHHLDIGAQAFHQALDAAGVAADRIHYELFPGGHGGLDHRYPLALAWLAGRLAV